MKKLIILLLLLPSFLSHAQKSAKNLSGYDRKSVNFGFTIGVNTLNFVMHPDKSLNFSGDIYSVESMGGYGFHLGPISNFRLGRFFDFRALINLTFGERSIEYKIKDPDNTENPLFTQIVNMESIFIEAPLLIKYRAVRIDNYRPYLVAGVNPKFDLAARKALKPEEMGLKLKLNTLDFYYEIGFGIDYYLPYFKLSTELKFALGNRNMLPQDGTSLTSVMDKMNSRMFVFSLHFE